MSDLVNGTGPIFLAAEVENFQAGTPISTPTAETLGVLPLGALELTPQPLENNSVLLVSDSGYVSRETDVGGLRTFPPLLVSAVEIDRQIDFSPNGQGAGAGWGSLHFVNNGDLNSFALTRNADGRAVNVRIGRKIPVLHPPIVSGAIPVIERGYDLPTLTTARTHTPTNSVATSFNQASSSWREIAQNAVRRGGSTGWRIFEGQRTNGIRNPRGEGGTSVPTNWSIFAAGGLTTTIVARGIQDGRDYVDLRFSGTATATFYVAVFDAVGASVAATQPVVGSTWVSLTAGSLAGITFSMAHRWSTGTVGSRNFLPTATPQRFEFAGIAPTGATSVFWSFGFAHAVGTVYDCTLRFSWPQLETNAAFASTPILPQSGAPAASTRGTEVSEVPLSALGIGINQACTVLVTGLAPEIIPATSPLFNLRRGGQNSAGALGFGGTGNLLVSARNVPDGAITGTVSSLDWRGQVVRAGMVVSPTSATVRACVAGGGIVSIPWRPDTAAASLRAGSSWTGGSGADGLSLFGQIGYLRVIPWELSDQALLNATVDLPTS